MFFFQAPSPTRYDLRFNFVGFPVRVHPLFWLLAVLLGAVFADPLEILIWVLVVFISVLLHEVGHALAFRRYGISSQIVLHGFGGLTIPESAAWGSRWANIALGPNQEIFVSIAGPGAGFLFAGLLIGIVTLAGGSILTDKFLGLIPLPAGALLPFGGTILNFFVSLLVWANVFWGVLNLIPVYPLDGGNVSRHIFLQVDPLDGVRKSLWLSVIVGTLLALAGFFLWRNVYMAVFFGLLAFQSYQSLQVRY